MAVNLRSLAKCRAAGEYLYCVRPRPSTPVACTDESASADAHTTHPHGGNRQPPDLPGSTRIVHWTARLVDPFVRSRRHSVQSPGGRKARGVGSVRLRELLDFPGAFRSAATHSETLGPQKVRTFRTRQEARNSHADDISDIVNVERLPSRKGGSERWLSSSSFPFWG